MLSGLPCPMLLALLCRRGPLSPSSTTCSPPPTWLPCSSAMRLSSLHHLPMLATPPPQSPEEDRLVSAASSLSLVQGSVVLDSTLSTKVPDALAPNLAAVGIDPVWAGVQRLRVRKGPDGGSRHRLGAAVIHVKALLPALLRSTFAAGLSPTVYSPRMYVRCAFSIYLYHKPINRRTRRDSVCVATG